MDACTKLVRNQVHCFGKFLFETVHRILAQLLLSEVKRYFWSNDGKSQDR